MHLAITWQMQSVAGYSQILRQVVESITLFHHLFFYFYSMLGRVSLLSQKEAILSACVCLLAVTPEYKHAFVSLL